MKRARREPFHNTAHRTKAHTMQWLLNLLGIGQMLPQGPLFGPWERSQRFPVNLPSKASYSAEPAFSTLPPSVPLIPVLPFGVAYDLDLVVVSKHPTWNMHEIARVSTPQGPVWIAKDAREPTLEQTITTDLPNPHTLFPELPVQRFSSTLHVQDRSTSNRLDLDFAYTNPDGEHTEIHYQGPPPTRPERLRNGSTMGHSKSHLLAVLDLSHKSFARRCSISYNTRPTPLSRLVGLVPFAMALQQVQGGLCTGSFLLQPNDPTHPHPFTTTHDPHAQTLSWNITHFNSTTYVTQHTANRSLTFLFHTTPHPHNTNLSLLELSSLYVHQWGRPTPTFSMTLSPNLPDLRFPFSQPCSSRCVLDVNGQTNHATATLHAQHSTPGSPTLTMLPEDPWWVADRPMRTTFHETPEGAISTAIERIEPA